MLQAQIANLTDLNSALQNGADMTKCLQQLDVDRTKQLYYLGW